MRSAIEGENLDTKRGIVQALDGTETVGRSMPRREGGLVANGNVSMGWVIRELSDQEMPSQEIVEVLSAHNPELVRRYLDLHRERLEERLADQRRTLARLERLLAARSTAAGARPREKGVAPR